jgi:hypothetical protein
MKTPERVGRRIAIPVVGYTGLRRLEGDTTMGIGASIFLLAVGAILAFAVDVPTDGLNLDAVGVIFMILGLVGLLASLVFWSDWAPRGRAVGYDDRDVVIRRRRPRVVDVDDDPVVDVVEDRPVVERRRVTTRRTTYDGF